MLTSSEYHTIEHALWDYFRVHRAKSTVEESAVATETLIVSPAKSTTEEWLEAGYGGYLEQLREITFKRLRPRWGHGRSACRPQRDDHPGGDIIIRPPFTPKPTAVPEIYYRTQ